MKIGQNNTNEKVYIVAEIGNNHEGNFEVAKKMLIAAAESGVDAVKFQTFKTELFINPENPTRFNQLKGYQLSYEQFKQLALIASDCGVGFMSTPFDVESADFLNEFVPAFKISSSDNNFYPLIERVIGFDKPLIMSCGIADTEGIQKTRDYIIAKMGLAYFQEKVALLHCVASYPTSPEEANLNSIAFLKKHFDCEIGYSDHTLGMQAAYLSVALGARIIEKHFTLDHNYSVFRDHQLSANPSEMKELVRSVRDVELLLGKEDLIVGQYESQNVLALRRSIASKVNLEVGHVLSKEDLCWTRPGGGFPPGEEHLLLGRKLKVSISAGERIAEEMLA